MIYQALDKMTDKRELAEFERGEIIESWKYGVKIVEGLLWKSC